MKEMTVEQMALINIMAYYDIKYKEGVSLEKHIRDIKKDPKRWDNLTKSEPAIALKDKAEKVLNAIMNDEILSKFYVLATNQSAETEKGPLDICLVNNEDKTAIFLYRGTGDREWLDNAEGFLRESSKMQKEALGFYNDVISKNKLVEKGYAIDVTGHSKGGNKAQYITIKSPYVRQCFSFEGQGFSNEFLEQNKEKIKRNEHKITNYASSVDYVHPLGNNIAGNTKWYVANRPHENIFQLSNYSGVANCLLAHSPSSYIHFDHNDRMHMNKSTKQSQISSDLQEICLRMMQAPKSEKAVYFKTIMASFQMMKKVEPLANIEMPTKQEFINGLKETMDFIRENGGSKLVLHLMTAGPVKISKDIDYLINRNKEELGEIHDFIPRDEVVKLSKGDVCIYQKKENNLCFIGFQQDGNMIGRLSKYEKNISETKKDLREYNENVKSAESPSIKKRYNGIEIGE